MAVRGENSLFFANVFDNSGLEKGKIDAVNIVSSLSSAISKINPFAALAVGAIAAFGAVTNEAYAFARKYEAAMLEVRTISAATNRDFKGIGNDIFKLSKDTLDDPVDLAKAYYQIVSAGHDGAAGLKVLEVASKAATAGVTDTKTAADGITTIMNAWGESAERVTDISDAMFKTVELGKTTFAELAGSISQVGPLAASLGVDFNEVLAAVATLTKQGVPTTQAMTQIRAALIGVNENLGDGWANAYTLQEAFQEMSNEAGGSTAKLTEMMGRIEGVSAILSTTGDNAEGAADDLEKLAGSAGSAGRAFDIMMSGNLNQFTIFKNNIRALTEELGNFALQASSRWIKGVNSMFENTKDVNSALKEQQRVVILLKSEIDDANTSDERRVELYEELKALYPNLLGNLNSETTTTEELATALEEVNEQLILKAAYQKTLGTIAEAVQGGADATYRKELAQENLRIANADTESKYQDVINVKRLEGLDPIARAVELQRQLLASQKELVDYKTGEISYTNSKALKEMYAANDALDYWNKNIDNAQAKGQEQIVKLKLQVDNPRAILDATLEAQLAAIKEEDKAKELSIFKDSQYEEVRTAAVKKQLELRAQARSKAAGEETNELSAFEKMLKERAQMYEDYTKTKALLGDDESAKLYADLIKENATYAEFLERQLEITEDFTKKKAIALAADDAGLGAIAGRAKLETLEFEVKPIVTWSDVEIDNESINAITRKINKLDEKRRAARSDQERAAIDVELDGLNKKLAAMQSGASEEMALYETVTSRLTDLTGKQLNDYIDYWKKKLAILKDGSAEEEEAQGKLVQAQTEKLTRITDVVTDNLSTLAGAFRSFGDEGTADLLDGLGKVSGSVNSIMDSFKGGQSKGDQYSSVASSVTSLVSLVVSAAAERKKAEEQYYLSVISFQKEYNQLLNEQLLTQEDIDENVFTTDFIHKIQNGLQALEDANSQYQESLDLLASGKVKEGQKNVISGGAVLAGAASGAVAGAIIGSAVPVLGTAIGAVVGGLIGLFAKKKKDLFVGLLDEFPELVQESEQGVMELNEELANALLNNDQLGKKTKLLVQDTLDWAERVREAREQIKGVVSDLAGGLGSSLRDALVGAFESGADAATAMGQEVSSVLQGILEQLIFDQIFSEQFKSLQEEMAKSFDIGGDQSWVDDFGRFFESGKGLTEDFNKALAQAQQAANEFGLDIFKADPTQRTGLAGGISTITEDTANVLAGTVNGIRVDVNNGLLVARESVIYLSQISFHTSRMVQEQELSNVRLTSIEKALS